MGADVIAGAWGSTVLCRWLGTVGQDRIADVFIMGVAGLDLLRDGVDVAKAAFELVGAEYGGGGRRGIGGIAHRERLAIGPGGGGPKGIMRVFRVFAPPGRQTSPDHGGVGRGV